MKRKFRETLESNENKLQKSEEYENIRGVFALFNSEKKPEK